ncbi:MAG: glycoside hydrolase family 28 protein [Bryobacteraceae bacterium]|jgi:polygalacturonase
MRKQLPAPCLGLVLALCLAGTQAGAAVFDVRAYGATGDGRTLDTAAINKAIDAAHAAGGGTVQFPAGTYLSGSIHLQSNIALYLDHGATIEATADPEAYDPPEPNAWDMYQDFGHSHWHNSLIWGEGLENVSILGPGLIHGKGLTREGGQRVGNKTIALKLCRNVIIRDVSILMAGHFGILASGVDNLTIDNLKIDTNRDGINIDACRHVRISNCSINSPWDDAIVLKSSYGLGFARATENVTITNCEVSGYDRGTFLNGTYQRNEPKSPDRGGVTGRIKLGTESNGGFRNITISNIVFERCRGLALETVDGGLLEDVAIANITMRDIVSAPIFLRLGSRMRGPAGTPVGKLRRVSISNLIVYNADPRYGSIISGIPGHPIEDVKLRDIRIYYQGGGTREQAALEPPENEGSYPDPEMFGVIPAYGFFIRHVRGIELSDVEVSYMQEDLRPPFLLNDVASVEFNHVKAQRARNVPMFVLRNVEDFSVHQSRPLPDKQLKSVKRRDL